MSTKPTQFQLFRYQILPIDRYLQGNLLTGVATIEELIQRKNEFFQQALTQTVNLSDGRHETATKRLFAKDQFTLLRIANNRSMHLERKDFTEERLDNWPSVLVAIWNEPDKQLIAVQKRTTAFSEPEIVVKMILSTLSATLAHYHLRVLYEPLFEKTVFWEIIEKYQNRIKSLQFDMVTPNMANISGTLPDELKSFAKYTNSARNSLKLESDPQAPLHINRENATLQGLVDYSSEGGGNISVKIDGIKKKYQTSKTIKEVHLGETVMQGTAEDIAQLLKEIMQ